SIPELLALDETRRRQGQPEPDIPSVLVVQNLRADLLQLASDAHESNPELHPATTQVLLLLDDVHLWGAAEALFKTDNSDKILDSSGLGNGIGKIPVAMYGRLGARNGALLKDAKESWVGTWFEPYQLGPFERGEDILAYQWWLLNPHPRLHDTMTVYAAC